MKWMMIGDDRAPTPKNPFVIDSHEPIEDLAISAKQILIVRRLV